MQSAQRAAYGVFADPLQSEHHAPAAHPERPARADAVLAALFAAPFADRLERREMRPATPDELTLAHSEQLIDGVRAAASAGRTQLDADTYLTARSYEVAARASGGTIEAVDAVLSGELAGAFVAARPPGHHAERSTPMGFCLFDHVAVAAAHLLERRGLERVAIVDFDVHHGNGTQDVFYEDGRVLYASLHESPLFPGSGAADERGRGDGEGTTLNLPQRPGSDGRTWLTAVEREMAPVLERFQPQFLLFSAGFDAHEDDPLARTELDTDDYARLTELVRAAAPAPCVSVLEGGYDLDALAASAVAHVRAGLTNFTPDAPGASLP